MWDGRVTRRSSSGTSSGPRPTARSASARRSCAARRLSSSRSATPMAKGSERRSARAAPRHRPRAWCERRRRGSRDLQAAAARPRKQLFEGTEVELTRVRPARRSQLGAGPGGPDQGACAAWRCTCPGLSSTGGGLSPQTPSINRSLETGLLASNRSMASTARCLGPPRGRERPSSTTSRGPSTAKCISGSNQGF